MVKSWKFEFQSDKLITDALSEQLKIIYLEERERINETNSEMKPTGTMKLNKFGEWAYGPGAWGLEVCGPMGSGLVDLGVCEPGI